MNKRSLSPRPGWLRRADTLFLLRGRRALLLLLLSLLAAALTWVVYPDHPGLLPALAAEFGATLIPLYLLLALAYTIARTRPVRRYLRLGVRTLWLIPIFVASLVLHNLIYAAFYPYFQVQGGDEGVFFLLALLGLPLYFLLALAYTAFTWRKGGETTKL